MSRVGDECGLRVLWSLAIASTIPDGTVVGQDRSGVSEPSVHVSADFARLPHAEIHLSVDPNDPSRLLAASGVFPDSQPHRVDVFFSLDSGRSWFRQRLPVPEQVARRAYIDPWTAITDDGSVYVSILAYEGAREERDRIVPWIFHA